MKPVFRYQSKLLFRRSYKPNRITRIRPAPKVTLIVRPARAGPQPIHMNTQPIDAAFAQMGARVKAREISSRWPPGV